MDALYSCRQEMVLLDTLFAQRIIRINVQEPSIGRAMDRQHIPKPLPVLINMLRNICIIEQIRQHILLCLPNKSTPLLA